MAYSAITNAEIDQDSPVTQTLMTKYRDNILAVKGMVFLASSDASGDATLDFTAFDASLYDAYLFILANVVPATDTVQLYLRTSTDGGSSFDSGSSDYDWVAVSSSESEIALTANVGSAAGEGGASGQVMLFGPHLAQRTIFKGDLGYQTPAGVIAERSSFGMRNAAEDVNAVRFLYSSGNIESGTITMYGLWNAA